MYLFAGTFILRGDFNFQIFFKIIHRIFAINK